MAGQQGIEIPVTINPDGTVSGFDKVIAGIERVKNAAKQANEELDKTAGGKAGPGGAVPAAGGAAFSETRLGQFVQNVASVGLTFVERALPTLMDPVKSVTEKAMAQAPYTARVAAEQVAGSSLAAAEKATPGGTGIPEEMKRQIIHVAGVAAEETAKALMASLQAQVSAARGGLTSTLRPFFEMGIAPDQATVEEMAKSFAAMGARMHAGDKMIGEAIDGAMRGNMDDSLMKVLNGPGSADLAGAMSKAANSARGWAGGS